MLVRYLIYLRIDKWLLTSLRNMGCCFNQYTKDSLLALPYMLRYGEKEQAENYFNHYIHSSKCRNRFVKAYSQLEKNDVIDCGLDNRFVILAYSQKLKIK